MTCTVTNSCGSTAAGAAAGAAAGIMISRWLSYLQIMLGQIGASIKSHDAFQVR